VCVFVCVCNLYGCVCLREHVCIHAIHNYSFAGLMHAKVLTRCREPADSHPIGLLEKMDKTKGGGGGVVRACVCVYVCVYTLCVDVCRHL